RGPRPKVAPLSAAMLDRLREAGGRAAKLAMPVARVAARKLGALQGRTCSAHTIYRLHRGDAASYVYRADLMLLASECPEHLITHWRVTAMRASDFASLPDAELVDEWWRLYVLGMDAQHRQNMRRI